MVVINLTTKEQFHGVHNAVGACDHAVYVIARVIPPRQSTLPSARIYNSEGMLPDASVIPCGGEEHRCLLGIEELRDEKATVARELVHLGWA
jgi:hypothetical protein